MINASKEFKEKLKNGANVVNYADFTLSDGTVLHLGPKDFMIGGCAIEDKTTDGKFGVGFSIGKTLSLRISNHDKRFSRYDFYGSIINLYVALKLDNSTIEKIRKGVYYTIVPETPGDIIEISAVDGMFKLDQDYSASKTAYPATLQRIISDACLDCGIPIGFRQFDNMSYIVKEKPEQGTYRQIVSYACQIAGYNARIDNNGSMQLVWYNTSLLDAYNYKGGDFHNYPHDTVVNGGNFKNYGANTILSGGAFSDEMPEHIFRVKSINVHTDDVQITGVRVSGQEEKTVLFGEEGYLIEVKENPFVNGKEQEVANYLGGRMVGMIFRPLSAEILNNPLYEPYDIVRVSDAKGNVYYTVLNSVSYTIGSYTTVACKAEDPVRNGSEYVSAAAQAVVEARRNTEKQLTTYDKAVQNMNQLTANAMGLFTESEKQSDGSSIFYQSTKPITVDSNGKCHFEAGSTVYKKQGEGFFVSRDGGKTYSSGFDADGNAVLNVLYAIGIVCDWIRGGVLELGGANNGNGQIVMHNDSGAETGRWNNDGLSAQGDLTMHRTIRAATSQLIEQYIEAGFQKFTDLPIPNLSFPEEDGYYGFKIATNFASQTMGHGGFYMIPYNFIFNDTRPYGDILWCDSSFSLITRNSGVGFGIFGVDNYGFYISNSNGALIAGRENVDGYRRGIDIKGAVRLKSYLHIDDMLTVTSSPNVCVGTDVNNMSTFKKSSSSSIRYKQVKKDLEFDDIKSYYQIQPVIAKYKDRYLSDDDIRKGVYYPMFIAEDVYKYFPDAVDFMEDGQVETWNERILIPAMFQMIKSQKETIDTLTERIEKIESLLLEGDE